MLIKIWLEVGKEEQERRFAARIDDPLRQWKLSPMDLESYRRWYDYSRARDMMLEATDSKHAPWHIVRSDDKRRARLNCISHILKSIPYKKVSRDEGQAAEAIEQGQIRRSVVPEGNEIRGRKILTKLTNARPPPLPSGSFRRHPQAAEPERRRDLTHSQCPSRRRSSPELHWRCSAATAAR